MKRLVLFIITFCGFLIPASVSQSNQDSLMLTKLLKDLEVYDSTSKAYFKEVDGLFWEIEEQMEKLESRQIDITLLFNLTLELVDKKDHQPDSSLSELNSYFLVLKNVTFDSSNVEQIYDLSKICLTKFREVLVYCMDATDYQRNWYSDYFIFLEKFSKDYEDNRHLYTQKGKSNNPLKDLLIKLKIDGL